MKNPHRSTDTRIQSTLYRLILTNLPWHVDGLLVLKLPVCYHESVCSKLPMFTFVFCYSQRQWSGFGRLIFQALSQRVTLACEHTLRPRKLTVFALVSNASVMWGISPFDLSLPLRLTADSLLSVNWYFFWPPEFVTWLVCVIFYSSLSVFSAQRSPASTALCFGWKDMANRVTECQGRHVRQNGCCGSPWWTCQRWSHFSFRHNNGM